MLSQERNEMLTRVGPGTKNGELMRRYWHPVALASDLDEWPSKAVRLLGEDLVLFKDGNGNLGLVERKCPHRGASLAYGVVEEEGLRCGYHGWLWDNEGSCLHQPGETDKSGFKDRVRLKAYKAEEMGGLIWAYMGPEPAPLLPRFDIFVRDGIRDIGHCMIPCNFVQIMENSVDPHHVEWLHGRYFRFINERSGLESPGFFQQKHQKIAFDLFEHGIIKRRLLEGQSEDVEDWKTGHPLVFPNMLYVGGGGLYQPQIRVPVDDTTTWHLFYTVHAPEGVDLPEQDKIPAYDFPYMDDNGEHIVDFVEGQDIMAWVTQGAVADRTTETLGKSDMGVARLRRLFFEEMNKVHKGEDPLGTVRDAAANKVIVLPIEKKKMGHGADFARDWIESGNTRHSPQKDLLLDLYEEANKAQTSETANV